MSEASHYIGNELELFSHAHNWKGYYKKHLSPFIKGEVLEVGAGIGETTLHLHNETVSSWLCLEPDASLASKIENKMKEKILPNNSQLQVGTTDSLSPTKLFDTIIYIDVIEHIENDILEIDRASTLLKPGGHLIILVPAHQYLFSPFDKAIGHYRRYNKARLQKVIPASLQKRKIFYLDCLGFFASLTNKWFLKKEYPTLKDVKFWDRLIVPVSKIIDPIIGYSTGKSLIGVWQKK
ncbi:MAG: class I SAM-dependent methyltransferase [Bacteroidetes bacterium]|nr:class I SAM-dependent methyltransferase [Bacteroidota bacterium]